VRGGGFAQGPGARATPPLSPVGASHRAAPEGGDPARSEQRRTLAARRDAVKFTPEDVRANREFFAAKVRGEKQKTEVVKKVKDGFAKEMNTGWTEWQEHGLPIHGDHEVPGGELRCTCSLS
jgi:hypothetical protein